MENKTTFYKTYNYPPPIGTTIRYAPHPNTKRVYHVQGIVDNLLVVREWWTTKQRWNYSILDRYWWDGAMQHGWLTVKVRKQNFTEKSI